MTNKLSALALLVASSEEVKDVQGGAIFKLDPAALNTLGSSHTDLKNFAMAISPDGQKVYVTHSLDGGSAPSALHLIKF